MSKPEQQPRQQVRSLRLLKRGRKPLRRVLSLRGSPHSIARGVAFGFILAFSPTIGAQIIMATILAPVLRANLPAMLLPLFLTNLITAVPIYLVTFLIGSWFWPGPSYEQAREALTLFVSQLRDFEFYQVASFLEIGKDLLIPMFIGGAIVGGLLAAVSYPLTVRAVTRYQGFYAKRVELRKARREARKAARAEKRQFQEQ